MKIAIYSRKSKLTDRGESIKNQIEMCKNYAVTNFNVRENDMTVYEDEGFSGGNTTRPEFQRMLLDISENKYDSLICYRLDRISRNVLDFSNILETLSKTDTSFVSITEHFDTTTPMGRAMVNIAAVFAQLERETISERLRDNLRRLALTGRYLGSTPPFGFIAERIEYTDQNGNKKKMRQLAPIEEKMKYIETIYEKYTEFRSIAKVETYLMQNEIRNENGNFTGITELRRILSNPVYVCANEAVYDYYNRRGANIVNKREEFTGENGMLIYGKCAKGGAECEPFKWTVVLAGHKGIINADRWIAVQLLLEENKGKGPRAYSGKKALLSSRIRCGRCGAVMEIVYGRNKELHYYKCKTKTKSRKSLCDIKNINGREADKEVLDYLKALSEDKEKAEMFINGKKDRYPLDGKALKRKITSINRLISAKTDEIKNLTGQLRRHPETVASKYILEEIETIDKEIQALKKDLRENKGMKEISDNYKTKCSISINAIEDLTSLSDNSPVDLKRKHIGEIVDFIIWTGEKLVIHFR